MESRFSRTYTRVLYTGVIGLLGSNAAHAFTKSNEIGSTLEKFHKVLNNEFTPLVLLGGVGISLVYSFLQQSLKPGAIAIGSGVLYGGTKTWIDSVYTLIQ